MIVSANVICRIHIIARVCAEEGWKCLKFYGGMHFEARDQAIIDFRAEEDACILISSIRCGGQGWFSGNKEYSKRSTNTSQD
jgi:SNF2 family DNA or RNA helicase